MPLWLLVWEAPEPPKRIQGITIALVCLPRLGGKMLLLKTPHTSVQTWRNQDGTDLDASSLLAFRMTEGALQATGEKKMPMMLPTRGSCMLG